MFFFSFWLTKEENKNYSPRFLLIDLEEHSVSDVLRSVVVSYALSGVTTTAALGKFPYTFRLVFDTLEFSYHVFEVDLCKMLELDLTNKR